MDRMYYPNENVEPPAYDIDMKKKVMTKRETKQQ